MQFVLKERKAELGKGLQTVYCGLKVLLLKAHSLQNFFCGEAEADRRFDPFFFHVVDATDHGNQFSGEAVQRPVHAQNIDVLFFAVQGKQTGHIAVIHRVNQIRIRRMTAGGQSRR